MLKKANVVLTICILALLFPAIFAGTASALELPTTTVYLADNGEATEAYQTTATTVKEFLAEKSETVILHEADLIDVDLSAAIEEGMLITITRPLVLRLRIDDSSEVSFERTFHNTIAEFIAEYEEQTNAQYVYRGSEEQKLENYMEITLLTKTEQVFAYEEAVPFETEIIESLDLAEGETQVVQEGVAGVKVITAKSFYEAEEEVHSVVMLELVIREPQTEIIKIGASQTVLTENGYKKYKQKVSMTATSYSLNFCCTRKNPGDRGYGITASGIPADHGVVAVDPNVIPLGTRLYIEGYGISIAADTGGAIKGNKIDLFFHDHSVVTSFGRQTRNVYILS